MLYREIIAVCSQIHTEHKLCGQNVELLNVKLMVHIVTPVNREGLDGHTAHAGEIKIAFHS